MSSTTSTPASREASAPENSAPGRLHLAAGSRPKFAGSCPADAISFDRGCNSQTDLRRSIDETRTKGYSVQIGEVDDVSVSLAIALNLQRGKEDPICLSITAPIERFSLEMMEGLASQILTKVSPFQAISTLGSVAASD